MLAQKVPGYTRLLDSHSFRHNLHFQNRPSTSLPMAAQRARPLRSVVVVVTVAAAGRIQAIPTWTPKKGWRLPSTMMKSQRS